MGSPSTGNTAGQPGLGPRDNVCGQVSLQCHFTGSWLPRCPAASQRLFSYSVLICEHICSVRRLSGPCSIINVFTNNKLLYLWCLGSEYILHVFPAGFRCICIQRTTLVRGFIVKKYEFTPLYAKSIILKINYGILTLLSFKNNGFIEI